MWSRWFLALAILLVNAVEALPGDGRVPSRPQITISSTVACQGDLILIRARVKKGERPQTIWMGGEIHLAPGGMEGEWWGFLGVDLKAAPKSYTVSVRAFPSGTESRLQIRVAAKDYGERRLTLPREMVDLDAPTLERVKRETEVMNAVLGKPPSMPVWKGPFQRPVEGEVVGSFGRRSIINEQPRSPHSGVDLRGEKGTPVRVMNHGRVALTCEHFFTGLSVVVDHGGGIYSMYFHLDGIRVKEGQAVRKGEMIGTVGSTGRATGPHLHLGTRVNGARVDPLRLIELSREMEK